MRKEVIYTDSYVSRNRIRFFYFRLSLLFTTRSSLVKSRSMSDSSYSLWRALKWCKKIKVTLKDAEDVSTEVKEGIKCTSSGDTR